MQTNCLFFYCFQSVVLKKATAFLVASLLLFNLILSPYVKSINLNNETRIQKDVFSTVLFVSETIGKISMSISNMLALKSDVSKTSTQDKSDKTDPVTDRDILFLSNTKNKKADSGVISLTKIFAKGIFDSNFVYEPHLRKRDHRDIVSNFLERLLFYISSKSTYDNIASLNNINRLFINPS